MSGVQTFEITMSRPAASADGWVQKLSITILVLTLYYILMGVPGEDLSALSDTSQTDKVSAYNSYVWLGLLAMSMPVLIRRWRDVRQLVLSNVLLLMLLGYFALSITWALDPSASARRFMFTIVQFLLFATLLCGMRRAPVMHVAIAAICSLAAVADLVFWVINPGVAMADDGFAGLQGQKNQAGLLMMYGILAAVPCIFLLRQWVWRIGLAGSTAIMLLMLFATRSSTSTSVIAMDLVLVPALLVIVKLPKRVMWLIGLSLLLGIATAGLGYLAWTEFVGRDPLLPLRGATFTQRTDIWSFVVEEIQKRPLLGAGYSSFWSIDPTVQPSLKSDQWFAVDVVINEAHNGYLDALATGGIFGLIGSVAVLFRCIGIACRAIAGTRTAASSWREGGLARPTAAFHLSLTLGLVLHNFTESNLFSNNALLAAALMLAMLDLEKWHITERARALL